MRDLFEFAQHLARIGGENTLNYFRQSFEVMTKADASPVTVADRSTEELLRAEIEKRFPNDGIIGEEYGVKQGDSGRKWILDPIDGTKSFVRGYPGYGTLVGLAEGDEPLIGVINCPAMGEMVSAYKGGGCWLNGVSCHVSKTADLSQATLCSSDFRDCFRYLGEQTMLQLFEKTGLQRTWGDCYGFLMLAAGRIDLMLDPKLQVWDLAAIIPIIEEAGGSVTQIGRAHV